jgi:cyclophilin family peptidyl-prolyl cis-trans isomerase
VACAKDITAVPAKQENKSITRPEGKLSTAAIVVGPFDLHRKYKSMEGPYVIQRFRVSDLVTSEKVIIPAPMITYVEGAPDSAPSMGGPSMSTAVPAQSTSKKPVGLIDTSSVPRELYWFKGIKLQVLDENDKPLPTAEFICHLNLDVDQPFRNKAFPDSEQSGNSRLMTLTQGQTAFYFPEDYAVPVAGDEVWSFTFQAANRTSEQHRRIKHLCTLEFIKDSDLKKPIKALHWYNPYIAVQVDKDKDVGVAKKNEQMHGPDCLFNSAGESASNMVAGSLIKDKDGHQYSGHWVIPPGTHTYTTPISEQRDPGFASKDRRIVAVWSHVHPLCTESSLVACDGKERKKIFSAKVKTKTAGGLELVHIDDVLSKQGILMPAGQHYELEATYANSTNENQDSMVALGVFFADDKFVKPEWRNTASAPVAPQLVFSSGTDGIFCGIKSNDQSVATPQQLNGTEGFPLFDNEKDGPLLADKKFMELVTSAGKIHIVLDPTLAPQHATQLYRLLKHGVFDGTTIYRYEPGFVLQVANAETKASGKAPIRQDCFDMLRRLPVELKAQDNGNGLHKQWVLSMARYDATDSAVSSFSILLGDAPHLDHQYTVFGQVIPDAETLATIEAIKKHWSEGHPFILSSQEVSKSLASNEQK